MKQPPFDNLSDWLDWQACLHPAEIELGLDRVRAVATGLGVLSPACHVITVGGTNGKGSSVAMLAHAYRSAGYRVGQYSSPHLLRYNERIALDGMAISDAALCTAFTAVEAARQGISLTYFEYGTLAALYWLLQQSVDVLILEVGLGGRLDAVNIIDADVALVTNVGMDHQDWLGDTRAAIAVEKAGICRAGRPAVYNDPDPEAEFIETCRRLGCRLMVLQGEYLTEMNRAQWVWTLPGSGAVKLPADQLSGVQFLNAAGVLATLALGQASRPLDLQVAASGFGQSLPMGRQEWLSIQRDDQIIEAVLDVSHNIEAVDALHRSLAERPAPGRTLAVFAALRDKPVQRMAQIMAPLIDEWHLGGLDVARGLAAAQMQRLLPADAELHCHAAVDLAWRTALSSAKPGDRVVVFGSFYTVEAVLKVHEKERSAGNV